MTKELTDEEIDATVETMARRGYDDEDINAFLAKHPHSWERKGAQGRRMI